MDFADNNLVMLINRKFFFLYNYVTHHIFPSIKKYSPREVDTFNNTLQIKPKCMYAQGQKIQTFSVVTFVRSSISLT